MGHEERELPVAAAEEWAASKQVEKVRRVDRLSLGRATPSQPIQVFGEPTAAVRFKRTGPWLRRTPSVDQSVPCEVSDERPRKTEGNPP
jgi:hypothetical protein